RYPATMVRKSLSCFRPEPQALCPAPLVCGSCNLQLPRAFLQRFERNLRQGDDMRKSVLLGVLLLGCGSTAFAADNGIYVGGSIGQANVEIREGLVRSEEHTSELQSRENLVCRL